MLSKAEIEINAARGIMESALTDIATIDRWWPKSKRGSNATHAFESLEARIKVAVQCCDDACAAISVQTDPAKGE